MNTIWIGSFHILLTGVVGDQIIRLTDEVSQEEHRTWFVFPLYIPYVSLMYE